MKFYKFAKGVITPVFKFLYRPTIIGEENILKNESLVLAGNHTNILDCFLLISSVPRQIRFLAKDSLFKGFTKPFMHLMDVIPVNRKIHDKESLKKAEEVLLRGEVIGIFPEGTINRTDDVVMKFKIGAVKMSKDTDSTLIPFVITGKYKLFRKSITIEFFKPQKVTKDLDEENGKLMEVISEGILKRRA